MENYELLNWCVVRDIVQQHTYTYTYVLNIYIYLYTLSLPFPIGIPSKHREKFKTTWEHHENGDSQLLAGAHRGVHRCLEEETKEMKFHLLWIYSWAKALLHWGRINYYCICTFGFLIEGLFVWCALSSSLRNIYTVTHYLSVFF